MSLIPAPVAFVCPSTIPVSLPSSLSTHHSPIPCSHRRQQVYMSRNDWSRHTLDSNRNAVRSRVIAELMEKRRKREEIVREDERKKKREWEKEMNMYRGKGNRKKVEVLEKMVGSELERKFLSDVYWRRLKVLYQYVQDRHFGEGKGDKGFVAGENGTLEEVSRTRKEIQGFKYDGNFASGRWESGESLKSEAENFLDVTKRTDSTPRREASSVVQDIERKFRDAVKGLPGGGGDDRTEVKTADVASTDISETTGRGRGSSRAKQAFTVAEKASHLGGRAVKDVERKLEKVTSVIENKGRSTAGNVVVEAREQSSKGVAEAVQDAVQTAEKNVPNDVEEISRLSMKTIQGTKDVVETSSVSDVIVAEEPKEGESAVEAVQSVQGSAKSTVSNVVEKASGVARGAVRKEPKAVSQIFNASEKTSDSPGRETSEKEFSANPAEQLTAEVKGKSEESSSKSGSQRKVTSLSGEPKSMKEKNISEKKKKVQGQFPGVAMSERARTRLRRSHRETKPGELKHLVESGKIKHLTVTKLRRLLSEEGLSTLGKKKMLVERLCEFVMNGRDDE